MNSVCKVGQIGVVGLVLASLDGKSGIDIPMIVTKEHEEDINCVLTYDFLIPVRGNSGCEFISCIESKERYLHRLFMFEVVPPTWFIDYVKSSCEDEDNFFDIPKEDIFYLNENNKEVFLFRGEK